LAAKICDRGLAAKGIMFKIYREVKRTAYMKASSFMVSSFMFHISCTRAMSWVPLDLVYTEPGPAELVEEKCRSAAH
jgi:hypothetical protein